jgi:hypothetical protein
MTGMGLVRIGPPSKGDVIHRADCRVLKRVRGKVLPWAWADRNPDVDWLALGTSLKACRICKPPSPASSA